MEGDALPPDRDERLERRVLLLPPTQRDAEAIRTVLSAEGLDCLVFNTVHQACRALLDGAAVLVISEEAFSSGSSEIRACLASQPVWADLPIIVLSRAGSESPKRTELIGHAGNVSVVERPVRISTFLSLVRVAVRGRTRQYEVREHLRRMQAIEAERTALWESERLARAEAERAGRMKDEFLATLSHEIRTPLNAILGWAHILGKGEQSPQDMELGLAIIERNAKAQAQMVADLLDMNRIINGKMRLEIQRISLAPVVQAAVDTVIPSAEAKGIRLQVILDPSTGVVAGDPERLQQVFWNLLSNAVKFTPKGERVEVLIARSNSHLEVSVVDTGEGIAADFLPYVFDRFTQADGSAARQHGGLGLGLAIVKQIVELHGGSVRAQSPGPGKGSTFVVALPLAAVDAADGPSEERRPATTWGGSPDAEFPDDIAGVKVLVVDDESDARDLVKRLLQDRGAQVTLASSAREALELVREWRPQIIISDIGMPAEDGYSFLRQVRRLPEGEGGHTVAIALTAYARAEDRVNTMRAGFQYHVSKPVDPTELIAVVASAARLGGDRPRKS